MGQVGGNQQEVQNRRVTEPEIFPVFPPIPNRDQTEWHTDGKVIKSQVEQVVVAIEEAE